MRIRGTFFLGGPIIRIIIYWGLYWGPPIMGNYHVDNTHISCKVFERTVVCKLSDFGILKPAGSTQKPLISWVKYP